MPHNAWMGPIGPPTHQGHPGEPSIPESMSTVMTIQGEEGKPKTRGHGDACISRQTTSRSATRTQDRSAASGVNANVSSTETARTNGDARSSGLAGGVERERVVEGGGGGQGGEERRSESRTCGKTPQTGNACNTINPHKTLRAGIEMGKALERRVTR